VLERRSHAGWSIINNHHFIFYSPDSKNNSNILT
jgi:hypothetical protein